MSKQDYAKLAAERAVAIKAILAANPGKRMVTAKELADYQVANAPKPVLKGSLAPKPVDADMAYYAANVPPEEEDWRAP